MVLSTSLYSTVGAGWALTDVRTYQDQGQQDKLDAATIYSLLENEIIPLYYSRSASKGYSEGWVKTVKNSIAQIAPYYTMKRQLDDYYDRFYNPLRDRYTIISAENNRLAREIAAWKEAVTQRWDNIRVVESQLCDNLYGGNLVSDTEFTVRHVVDEQGLDDAIGIDLVVMRQDPETGNDVIYKTYPMQVVKNEGNLYTFELKTAIDVAGSFRTAFRMYPKNRHVGSTKLLFRATATPHLSHWTFPFLLLTATQWGALFLRYPILPCINKIQKQRIAA